VRKPLGEIGAAVLDALGVAAEIHDRPGLSDVHQPSVEHHAVARDAEVGLLRIGLGALREVEQFALLGIHPSARAGVGEDGNGDEQAGEEGLPNDAPHEGIPLRCAASKAASCSGVASRWCFRLPVGERLAVNGGAGFVLRHADAALFGGFAVPVGQAVAAEAGEDHQIDVLHVAAVVHEVPEEARKAAASIWVVS
jgi:hypothetical protein